jgi:hypothetical protein
MKKSVFGRLFRFRGECPAAYGVLFFAKKVGGVRDPEKKSFLSEQGRSPYSVFGANTPQQNSNLTHNLGQNRISTAKSKRFSGLRHGKKENHE